ERAGVRGQGWPLLRHRPDQLHARPRLPVAEGRPLPVGGRADGRVRGRKGSLRRADRQGPRLPFLDAALTPMPSVLGDPRLEELLARRHGESAAQAESMTAYFTRRAAEGTLDWNGFDADANAFLRDKLVALDREKAELCYALCRALRATRVVE